MFDEACHIFAISTPGDEHKMNGLCPLRLVQTHLPDNVYGNEKTAFDGLPALGALPDVLLDSMR